jgi:hypothetical protein
VPLAVVVPGAPALLPGATGRPVPELEAVRAACASALGLLRGPVTVVGAGTRSSSHPVDAPDTLGGFGVPGVGRPGPGEPLPLPLAMGRAHLAALGRTPSALVEVGPTDDVADGLRRDAGEGRGGPPHGTAGDPDAAWLDARALVVVAEGSLVRDERGPGGYDPRGAAFDVALADCLGSGDAAALAAVPADLAGEVGCAGLPALRALAAWGAGRTVSGRLLHAAAPLGVGYLVATWTAS